MKGNNSFENESIRDKMKGVALLHFFMYKNVKLIIFTNVIYLKTSCHRYG